MSAKGSCHCGQTQFELDAAPTGVSRCTCSFCTKSGSLWAYYTPKEFRLTSQEGDAIYRWQSKTVKHHFCSNCGCRTYSESPDWSTGKPDFDNPRIGVNAWIIDDVDVPALPVTILDGRNLW